MKTIITVIKLLIAFAVCLFIASADAYSEVKREGNNFVQVSTGSRSDTVVTSFTYEVNKVKYPIIINRKTTRCWIRKEGNKSKTYLPEEVEMEVCKGLGITYIPKKKRSK